MSREETLGHGARDDAGAPSRRPDNADETGDATEGGADTERGGRDAGMPGPTKTNEEPDSGGRKKSS